MLVAKLTLLALEPKRAKPIRNRVAPAVVEALAASVLFDDRHPVELAFRGAKSLDICKRIASSERGFNEVRFTT